MQEIKKLFKDSFFNLPRVIEAKAIRNWQFMLYGLFLVVVMALPIAVNTWTEGDSLIRDVKEIAEKVPDFTIKNQTLQTKATGFIYQTNHIIFTFDPENKRTTADIQEDAQGSAWAIALQKNGLVISFPRQFQDVLSLEYQAITLNYDRTLAKLDGEHLRKALKRFTQPAWVIVFIYLMSFIPAVITVGFNTLFFTIFGLILNRLAKISLRFVETARIMLFTSTVPVLVSTVASFILPSMDMTFFQIVGTILLYNQILKANKSQRFEGGDS